jgi:hypothetical protein
VAAGVADGPHWLRQELPSGWLLHDQGARGVVGHAAKMCWLQAGVQVGVEAQAGAWAGVRAAQGTCSS